MSLITGASCLKYQVLPLPSEADSDENEELKEEGAFRQKHGHKKDTCEWSLIAQYEVKDHEPEDINHLVFTECKKLMEAS